MQVTTNIASGIVGNTIELSNQELIILANLRDSLEANIKRSNTELEFVPMPIGMANNIHILLTKLTGKDIMSMIEIEEQLFSLEAGEKTVPWDTKLEV